MRHETFGQRIHRRRLELGLTVREVARRTGKSATLISRLENSKEKASLKEETVRQLAHALQDSFDELMLLMGKLPCDILTMIVKLRAEPKLLDSLRVYLDNQAQSSRSCSGGKGGRASTV